MQTVDSVQNYYETLVTGYDDLSDKVVMENTALQQAIFDAINISNDSEFRMLDLGIGTASTAKKILARYPHAYVVGVDFSDEMIRVAAHTLSEFFERTKLVQEDINELELRPYGKFDLVISAVTIHNIPHASKATLFKEVFQSLTENGVFINGDFVAGETENEENETAYLYRNFLESNLSGDELHKWLEHAFEFDMPMKLSEQITLLKAAGFNEVRTVWQHPREAVYVATK